MSEFDQGVLAGVCITTFFILCAITLNHWFESSPEEDARRYRDHFNRFWKELER